LIVVVGLSHHSAPVEVRERLAIAPTELAQRLLELKTRTQASEMVLLSTCNRVEVVAAASAALAPAALGTRILAELEARAPAVGPHLYLHPDLTGVEHLFRVASALDSLVVGEPQILGQLKDAFAQARAARTVGPWLNRVFEHAFRVAKRVRAETALGRGQVSIPTVAFDLAQQIFSGLAGHRVVLIGTGEMAIAVAQLFGRAGARLAVVGRTLDRARAVAHQLGAEARNADEVASLLVEADIVVSSTNSPGFVVSLAQLRQVRRQRHGRNLFLVDLAVPRDIDPLVASLDGVFLYNVDNLAQVAEEALLGRRLEADKASAIVVEEARVFLSRAHAERITPSLVALRNRFRGLLEAELERSLRGNRAPADDRLRKSLHAALVAAVEKTLHGPTERLRAWAKDDSFGDWHTDLLLSAITELFDLREDADDTVGVREGGKS